MTKQFLHISFILSLFLSQTIYVQAQQPSAQKRSLSQYQQQARKDAQKLNAKDWDTISLAGPGGVILLTQFAQAATDKELKEQLAKELSLRESLEKELAAQRLAIQRLEEQLRVEQVGRAKDAKIFRRTLARTSEQMADLGQLQETNKQQQTTIARQNKQLASNQRHIKNLEVGNGVLRTELEAHKKQVKVLESQLAKDEALLRLGPRTYVSAHPEFIVQMDKYLPLFDQSISVEARETLLKQMMKEPWIRSLKAEYRRTFFNAIHSVLPVKNEQAIRIVLDSFASRLPGITRERLRYLAAHVSTKHMIIGGLFIALAANTQDASAQRIVRRIETNPKRFVLEGTPAELEEIDKIPEARDAFISAAEAVGKVASQSGPARKLWNEWTQTVPSRKSGPLTLQKNGAY